MSRYLKHIIFLGLFFLLDFKCPFYYFLHITCPACGVTRAWISLIKGDIVSAMAYNPFFLPLSAIFVAVIYCDISGKKMRRYQLGICLGFAFIAFVYNICRNIF